MGIRLIQSPRLTSWTRAVSWHRRLLAAAAAATAIAFVLEALEPPTPDTEPALVASRDLAAGRVLQPTDVRRVQRPAETVPVGAETNLSTIVGRAVAGPVSQGEVLTNVRILGPPMIKAMRGKVATPVRLADPGVGRLLRAGDRVDVLAAAQAADGTTLGTADIVASDVTVVAVPAPAESDQVTGGALIVLAASPAEAQALAGAAMTSQITVTMLPG
jgi:pilus assembly protein CpaB